MTRSAIALLIALPLAACTLLSSAQSPQAATAPGRTALRVGTFEPRSVALAYGRSAATAKARKEIIDGLTAQRDAARKAGDLKKAAEIEAQGAAMQDKAHVQVFIGEQLDDILFELKPAFPKIARDASVDLIVSAPLYQAADAQTIDVTDAIVNHIGVDDTQTRKMIAELRKQPPVPHGTKIQD